MKYTVVVIIKQNTPLIYGAAASEASLTIWGTQGLTTTKITQEERNSQGSSFRNLYQILESYECIEELQKATIKDIISFCTLNVKNGPVEYPGTF